jgi:hypothetical protein
MQRGRTMRNFWLTAVVTFGLSAGATAQTAGQTSGQTAGHRAVIEAQIAAFLADDFVAAFDFASPNIRAIFQNPERFGQMVAQGYPMVHRPSNLRFLEQSERGGAIVQRVMITDGGGRLHVVEYEMIEAADTFLINGVRIIPGQGAGA